MANRTRRQKPTATTQAVTAGTVVRIETPKSGRQKQPNIVVMATEDISPSGFIEFLKDYAVVGLAIGFIIGNQALMLVKQLVASFIDPSFQLLFGQALQKRSHVVHFHNRAVIFPWGAFLYDFLDFLLLLVVIFVIVKFFNLDKLTRPKKK